ncbi:hypothetical protein ACFLS5_02020 [Candidatus Bipolaricaulota bacterium]
MILVLAIAVTSASATEWEEISGATTFVSDLEPGLSAVIFNVEIVYDEAPDMMRPRITWEVLSVDGATQTVLYEHTKNSRRRNGSQNTMTNHLVEGWFDIGLPEDGLPHLEWLADDLESFRICESPTRQAATNGFTIAGRSENRSSRKSTSSASPSDANP